MMGHMRPSGFSQQSLNGSRRQHVASGAGQRSNPRGATALGPQGRRAESLLVRCQGQPWSPFANVAINDLVAAPAASSGSGSSFWSQNSTEPQAHSDSSTKGLTLGSPYGSASSASSLAAAGGRTCAVRFWLKLQTQWGQSVKVTGSSAELGAWDIRYAPELRWAKGDMWTTVLEVPACGVHEYKYVIVDGSTKQEMAWQQGNNSVLAVGPDDTELSVYDNWANNLGAAVAGANGKSMTRAEKLQEWASGLMKERAMVEQWKRDNQGLKSEIARQRMEMGLMAQAAREREEQIMLLRRENERLQSELAISKTEMAGSFEEALRLLEREGSHHGSHSNGHAHQYAMASQW